MNGNNLFFMNKQNFLFMHSNFFVHVFSFYHFCWDALTWKHKREKRHANIKAYDGKKMKSKFCYNVCCH